MKFDQDIIKSFISKMCVFIVRSNKGGWVVASNIVYPTLKPLSISRIHCNTASLLPWEQLIKCPPYSIIIPPRDTGRSVSVSVKPLPTPGPSRWSYSHPPVTTITAVWMDGRLGGCGSHKTILDCNSIHSRFH